MAQVASTEHLDWLIAQFRAGRLSRREFLQRSSAAAGLLAVGGALPRGVVAQETPKPGGTFTYGLNQEPESFDPAVTTYAVTNKVNINVFDPLIWQAPDLSYVPGLAEAYEVAPDGTAFTFHLRRDVRFHDGTPVNAEAVKFSWDRIMNPETKSKTALNQMGPFKQAVVVDEFTVRAEFNEPFAPFLDAASQSYCAPVSPTAVAKHGSDFAHNLVGTGPYMLKEWIDRDHITLVKNPDYNWAPSIFGHQGAAYLDEIIFKFIVDDATRVGTLQSEETDGIDAVPPKDVAGFQDDPDTYQIITAPVTGIPNLLAVNTELAPTNDLAVRQALNLGIDKATIIQTLFFGLYVPGYGPLNAATLGFDPTLAEIYPYDPERAESTLQAAGWAKGADGIYAKGDQRAAVSYFTTPQDVIPPLLQAQWKEIGIESEIKQMDYNALIPLVTKGDHNLASIGWIQADPDVARILLYSKNIENGYGWTRFRSAELDDLLVRAAATVDAAQRTELYGQIQQIAMRNALVVPIHDLAAIYALRSYVKGFRVDTRGWYPWLYDVYLDR